MLWCAGRRRGLHINMHLWSKRIRQRLRPQLYENRQYMRRHARCLGRRGRSRVPLPWSQALHRARARTWRVLQDRVWSRQHVGVDCGRLRLALSGDRIGASGWASGGEPEQHTVPPRRVSTVPVDRGRAMRFALRPTRQGSPTSQLVPAAAGRGTERAATARSTSPAARAR